MASEAQLIKRIQLEPTDGRPKISYRIQRVDSSLVDEAVAFMVEHFITRETICTALDFASDKEALEGISNFLKEHLSKGYSIAGLLEDEQGNPGKIISCNVLILMKEGDIKKEITHKTKKLRIICKVCKDSEGNANIFEKYDCSSYLTAFGLCVHPEYTQRGIAAEMLRARSAICRMTGAPVSVTVFTSESAQRVAEKVGYETIADLDLTEYRFDGELVFKNPKTRFIKFTAKRYCK